MSITTWKDFMLNPNVMHAISECGFEHPSEVQSRSIPSAISGSDILVQAKSGMGKTAVFVISTLHLEPEPEGLTTIVVAHSSEMTDQITKEYVRFSKYLPKVKVMRVTGGRPAAKDIEEYNAEKPTILVGTPGRLMDLIADRKAIDVSKVKYFVVDECDLIMDPKGMRPQLQSVFLTLPRDIQVMMVSATLDKEVRQTCMKFMKKPEEIIVDEDERLILHGIVQYKMELDEREKTRALGDLLDQLQFNQCIIFVKNHNRAKMLSELLNKVNFPSEYIYGGMPRDKRLAIFQKFKEYKLRMLVSTDLLNRGVDFSRVNIVFNFDLPTSPKEYLHRVGRTARFGTKGLAISFVAGDEDKKMLEEIEKQLILSIQPKPDEIDSDSYMGC